MEIISPGSFCPKTIADHLDQWLAQAPRHLQLPGAFPRDSLTVTSTSGAGTFVTASENEHRSFVTASEAEWFSVLESMRSSVSISVQDFGQKVVKTSSVWSSNSNQVETEETTSKQSQLFENELPKNCPDSEELGDSNFKSVLKLPSDTRCWEVIRVAMKKYYIKGEIEDYSLFVIYDETGDGLMPLELTCRAETQST